MKRNWNEQANGYLETISRGIQAVRRFRGGMTEGTLSRKDAIGRLKKEIGAGAGLSTAAGLKVHEVFRGFRGKVRDPGYVFRRLLSLSGPGDFVGLVGQAYLL